MNIYNHLLIANVVQQSIEDQLSIKIDKRAFRYGNIKPDISVDFVNIPHYINDAMEFIDEQIKELIETKMEEAPEFTKQFSEKLGIITHYLSDFFCYAHSDNYNGGHLSHHIYETRLSAYFNKHIKKIRNHRNQIFLKTCPDSKSICSYVFNQYVLYLKKSPSNAVDTFFTIKTCVSVCTSIVSACFVEKLEKSS